MVKRYFILLVFTFLFIRCDKGSSLFELYSVRCIESELTVQSYNLLDIDYDMANSILLSLSDKSNYISHYNDDNIIYKICDKNFGYNIDYTYCIKDMVFYGINKEISCDTFVCINKLNSLYTKGTDYICEIHNILIFNIGGKYYQVPYTLKVRTNLHMDISVELLFI